MAGASFLGSTCGLTPNSLAGLTFFFSPSFWAFVLALATFHDKSLTFELVYKIEFVFRFHPLSNFFISNFVLLLLIVIYFFEKVFRVGCFFFVFFYNFFLLHYIYISNIILILLIAIF